MEHVKELCAIEQIRQVKSRYFREVNTSDSELVRSILADDCGLDYTGCYPLGVTDTRSCCRESWVLARLQDEY
jgi:hypothetical protein